MPSTPEIEKRINNLRTELDKAISHYDNLARAAYWTAHILMILTIGASVAATLCGLFLNTDGQTVGGYGRYCSDVKPAGRANWHYRKKDGLFELSRRLLYQLRESPSADNVAAIFGAWTHAYPQDEWRMGTGIQPLLGGLW